MVKQRLRLVDFEALSFHYQVPQSTLRRWAVEDGWHKYGQPRARLWSMLEVQASFELRRSVSACA